VAGPATRMNVRRITPRDAWEAGYVLTDSHQVYPAFRHCFPDPGQRRQVIRTVMGAAALDVARRGMGYLARIRGVAVGAALWLPPGVPPRRGWDTVRLSAAMLPAVWSGRTRFFAFARVGTALEHDAESEDGWYLQALGVDPRQQGRGIGSRVLAPILEAADSRGVTCALHTSDPANTAFYERLGFVVVAPLRPVTPGGPAYLRMRRHPR
jgi:GNAT superfamily N-acetyltransferase